MRSYISQGLVIAKILLFMSGIHSAPEQFAEDIQTSNAIPEGETRKGDIPKGTSTYWMTPNGSVSLERGPFSDYRSLIFGLDSYAVTKVAFINLEVGENYTVDWKHYASAELIETGSFNITVSDDVRENNTHYFNVNISNIIQVHAVNVSISDSNGTLLDWNWDANLIWYDWDWVEESTDWSDNIDVKASDGDEISADFNFIDLKPGQEYNVSWKVFDNDEDDYPMIIDNGYELVTSEDGTYDATVSFDFVEGTAPCVEYTIGIDDHRGQTFRKCIIVTDNSLGLPWASSLFTIVTMLGAVIAFQSRE